MKPYIRCLASVAAVSISVLVLSLPVRGWDLPPPPPTPPSKCVYANCGDDYLPPPYRGPSPEEQRRQREAKDSREASDDANDKGVEYYERGDWQNAVKYFREALEYSPDDPGIRANLGKAEQKARERVAETARASEAARQLIIVDKHSEQARPTADSKEAQRGFDTGGRPAGTLGKFVVGGGAGSSKEPVVPTSKRTPAITALESQRDESKKQVQGLEEKLRKLDPGKDTVEIAKAKQEKSTVESKVQFLNFSIGEMLNRPAQDILTNTAK